MKWNYDPKKVTSDDKEKAMLWRMKAGYETPPGIASAAYDGYLAGVLAEREANKELVEKLARFEHACFTCPDCGYKVMPEEFIESEL